MTILTDWMSRSGRSGPGLTQAGIGAVCCAAAKLARPIHRGWRRHCPGQL